MVKTVSEARFGGESGESRALIVEIVGPAGAGKTTLFRTLAKVDPRVRIEYLPPVRDFGYIPFFVKHILGLAPNLVQMLRQGGRILNRQELAWMAMLKGWPMLLKKKAEGDPGVILLDQGPIFLMAILAEFGPESLRCPELQGYWEQIDEQWTQTLDVVIWLDTADEILIQRIRTRQDEHMVKDKTDQEIKSFLAKYRRAYESSIHTIAMNNHQVRVLKMDTGKNSVDELVRCVLEVFPNGNREL
jgi:adenylate kinase family enzyme